MNVATRATTNAAPMPPHAAAPAAAMAPMSSGPPQQAMGARSSHPRPFSLFSLLALAVLEWTGDLAPRPGGVPTEERGADCSRLSSNWLILIITLAFLVADPRKKTESRTPDLCGAGDVLLLERLGTTTGYLRRYRSRLRSSSWRFGSPWGARAVQLGFGHRGHYRIALAGPEDDEGDGCTVIPVQRPARITGTRGWNEDIVATAPSVPSEGATLLGNALADAKGDDTGHEVCGCGGGEPDDTAHAPGGEALIGDEHPV